MEIFLLDEHDHRWCPTCRAPSLVTRGFVAVEFNADGLEVLERGLTVVCETCDTAVLV